MRRLSPLFPTLIVLILVAACGAPAPGATGPAGATSGPGATQGGGGSTAGPGATAGPGSTPGPAATQSGGGTVIPASCAAGFIDYLKYIEPVTAGFDRSTATMDDLQELDQAVQEKDMQLMEANNYTATYSCSEVGLEFAYFDSRSPWPAIHQIAAAEAPGTVGYLQATEIVSAADLAAMTEFGLSCDEAAAKIKSDVAAAKADGAETIGDLPIDDGVALLRLYNAYNGEVREQRCSNSLGNDEFGFMI